MGWGIIRRLLYKNVRSGLTRFKVCTYKTRGVRKGFEKGENPLYGGEEDVFIDYIKIFLNEGAEGEIFLVVNGLLLTMKWLIRE